MTRCDCCDLPAGSCGKAAEQRQRAELAQERRQMLTLPGVFAAGYGGTCARCGGWFAPGAPISRDGTGYAGPCCLEAVVRQ